LRSRLIVVFLAATLVPLSVTLWIVKSLLDESLSYTSTRQLDELSTALESTGRAYYQQARELLQRQVQSGKITPVRYAGKDRSKWPDVVQEFADSSAHERFAIAGAEGKELDYIVRQDGAIAVYSMPLAGPGLKALANQHARARQIVDQAAGRDLHKGFTYTFVLLAAAVWIIAFIVLIYCADRVSRPIRELTAGLTRLAAGDLSVRLDARGSDEVAQAMRAFNESAEQLRQSRDRLVYLTRLASWQTLARKMVHEVKNSLTPIRLTMEELIARRGDNDVKFIEQAAQIVVDEVTTLERRVRAFNDFAAEPPVRIESVDINLVIEDRISLLKNAHPEVQYESRLAAGALNAEADVDLIKGVLTNLLENAADAAGRGGKILVTSAATDGKVIFEVHDSGPGLSLQARGSLFEPTISFKKTGMGLGLSIAHKSTTLSGGDISLIGSALGGAAFRVTLRAAEPARPTPPEAAESWRMAAEHPAVPARSQ
jgi:signal transduction histidine kinase